MRVREEGGQTELRTMRRKREHVESEATVGDGESE